MDKEILQKILNKWFDNGDYITREVYGRPLYIGSHNDRCSTVVDHTEFLRVFQYHDGNSYLNAFDFEISERDHVNNLVTIGMFDSGLDFSFEQKNGGLSCYTDIRPK